MFAFLAAHRAKVFPDADYADLFAPPGVGRPSLPASVMAAVLALQALHDYSDRETAKAVGSTCGGRRRPGRRWMIRVRPVLAGVLAEPDRPLSAPAQDQRRGQEGRRADRDLEGPAPPGGGLHHLGRCGGYPGHRRPADGVIRKVAREVPGAAGQIAAVCTGHDYPRRASRRSTGMTRRRKTRWCPRWSMTRTRWWPRWMRTDWTSGRRPRWRCWPWSPGRTSSLLRADGRDGRWRIARKVAEGRVISTVDPDARHTRKSPEARRDGYRAHVAADPETGIITDEKLTKAAGQENSDPAVAGQSWPPRPPERQRAGRRGHGPRPRCRRQPGQRREARP